MAYRSLAASSDDPAQLVEVARLQEVEPGIGDMQLDAPVMLAGILAITEDRAGGYGFMITVANADQLIAGAMGLALGLLVGIQRGWALRDWAAGSRFAGIRTFALIGLAGSVAGVLNAGAPAPAVTLLVAVCVLVVLGYERATRVGERIDGTSGVVALLTLASGFLAGSGEQLLGTAVAVVMVLLLAMRTQLHGWISRLSEKEVLSIARFALIALVILPLLPDRSFGPYLAWNPRKLWLIVVLVCGFSFAGYFAARVLGPRRGIIATAAAGSLVSSTAVTASLATKMKEGAGGTTLLAAGISAASVVMFLRVLALVAVLAPMALAALARLVAPGILVSLAFTVWYLRRAGKEGGGKAGHEVEMRNPFDIGPAVLLTLMVMAMTVGARWVLERYGGQGLSVVLAISGTVDVDSAIITLGNLPERTLDPETAGLVLAVPVVLNTAFKAFIAVSVGGWHKGRHGAVPLLACILPVIAAWALLR
ncbi:MAG TPA: MgtC/SapB family protein [Novosphingobium sp.]|nr:MgtC/SapB family protein [Novosphingobium sp.]